MLENSEPNFPMLGFIYNAAGFYGDPMQIVDKASLLFFLETEVVLAFVEGREVRITDRTGDDMLMHICDGKVLWLCGGDTQAAEETLRMAANKMGYCRKGDCQ